MNDKMIKSTKPPIGFDFQHWILRWDKMQERYNTKRKERFFIIKKLLKETQDSINNVLDLGCGTGSLMIQILEEFPQVNVTGIDFDPTMILLAQGRMSKYGDRAEIILTDLRQESWLEMVPKNVEAVISATALHWFTERQLSNLYGQIAKILRNNGIFLNADHVRNQFPAIQKSRENARNQLIKKLRNVKTDDWDGFWMAYTDALGMDFLETNQRVIGGWDGGVEEGLPLEWHFEKLKQKGFYAIDCFWRYNCDAIYGGVKSAV